jgi:hypothetical protein
LVRTKSSYVEKPVSAPPAAPAPAPAPEGAELVAASALLFLPGAQQGTRSDDAAGNQPGVAQERTP